MTPKQTLLRGRTLNFSAEPTGPEDTGAYQYCEDGAVLIEGDDRRLGRLCIRRRPSGAAAGDRPPPASADGGVHRHAYSFPAGAGDCLVGAQLLDWLNSYTFPEETRFASPDHSAAMAGRFYDLLLGHGTTTAVAYCSVHKASADAFFTEAARRDMRMIGGKVMMDRNAPDGLMDTPQSGYDDTQALIRDWHGKGRASYAITPRFAITSTPAQMEMAQALVAENPDCYVQTHLSENHAEIDFTRELYPQARDYLDVYETYGLLGPKALLGHAIHLTPREIDALAGTRAHPVFCPTSNLFLGSGLFDDAGLRARGIGNAIATDVGAGTSYSMLQTLNEGYKVLQLQGQSLHPLRAFHWITRGNAVTLGLESKIGTLDAGTEADVVVLDARATPAMDLRMNRAGSLSDELFILQMLGDDRAVAQVYVAGRASKGAQNAPVLEAAI